jgi:hypothetical protein
VEADFQPAAAQHRRQVSRLEELQVQALVQVQRQVQAEAPGRGQVLVQAEAPGRGQALVQVQAEAVPQLLALRLQLWRQMLLQSWRLL